MYFLNSPSKDESICWWKKPSKEFLKSNTINMNLKLDKENNYTPFKLKIIDKTTHACVFCPWFRFCTGCTLEPNNNNYLNFLNEYVIVVEWNKDIIINDINKNNLNLMLNHSSYNGITETTNDNIEKITIDDCFKLYTRKEEFWNSISHYVGFIFGVSSTIFFNKNGVVSLPLIPCSSAILKAFSIASLMTLLSMAYSSGIGLVINIPPFKLFLLFSRIILPAS